MRALYSRKVASKKVVAARVWNAYLRVASRVVLDEEGRRWLSERGIEPAAVAVLRHVRRDALPLVRRLEKRGILGAFSFLVHDRSSGVPAPPGDNAAYIHLRLVLKRAMDVRRVLPKKWVMLTPIEPTSAESFVHEFLNPQSAWYLSLVERFADPGLYTSSVCEDFDILKLVGQHLHYFANMSQMVIA